MRAVYAEQGLRNDRVSVRPSHRAAGLLPSAVQADRAAKLVAAMSIIVHELRRLFQMLTIRAEKNICVGRHNERND